MNKIMRSTAIAIAITLAPSATSHAWTDYTPPEDGVWEEISMDMEVFSAGTVLPFLPDGARSMIIERTQYFVSGGNWFLPIVSEEGVKYQIVFAPM
jgi:hypothetical protein